MGNDDTAKTEPPSGAEPPFTEAVGVSWVQFDEAFDGVMNVDLGQPMVDPRTVLSPSDRRDHLDDLKDVLRAQRYAETLGAVPRR